MHKTKTEIVTFWASVALDILVVAALAVIVTKAKALSLVILGRSRTVAECPFHRM